MITAKYLRQSLESSVREARNADAIHPKSALLDGLYEKLAGRISTAQGKQGLGDSFTVWLNRRSEFPVESSRLDFSDLERQMKGITWNKLNTALGGLSGIVWDSITVAAGDCDECLGEELIFMWDSISETVVRQCDLCGTKLNLVGDAIKVATKLDVPTSQQLISVGLLG